VLTFGGKYGYDFSPAARLSAMYQRSDAQLDKGYYQRWDSQWSERHNAIGSGATNIVSDDSRFNLT